jgi:hypothetical protein
VVCPNRALRRPSLSQGHTRGARGEGDPYGGWRTVWSQWLPGHLAALASSQFANPFEKSYKQLPGRFRDTASFAFQPRREHPCYSTSAAEIGARRPSALEMPLLWCAGAVMASAEG